MRIAALDIGGTSIKSGLWTGNAFPGNVSRIPMPGRAAHV